MALVLAVDPIVQALVLSGAMLLVASAVMLLYSALKPKSEPTGSDMYLGGEHESVLGRPIPSAASLYWAIIKRSLAEAYRILVEYVHSGRLSDWVKYMSSWYGFLILVAVLSVIIAVLGVK